MFVKFQIVDAFTDTLFGGNPAGVVFIPEGETFPDDETMRKTAAELRYSETAFVKRLKDDQETGRKVFHTRYFTPAAEVDLCGHATIGSSYALLHDGIIESGETICFHTLAGPIDIEVGEGGVLMGMGDPASYGMLSPDDSAKLYEVLGLAPRQAAGKAPDALLPEMVSTGLIDIMTPVEDEKELEQIEPDFKALSALSQRMEVVGAHAFTMNAEDGMIHARNFAPLYDIDEEAATGTSNGALAFYLYKRGLVEADKVYTVVQGEKMGRPSKISFQVKVIDGEPAVRVGGSAVTLAEGNIEIKGKSE